MVKNEKSDWIYIVLYRDWNAADVGHFKCVYWIFADLFLHVVRVFFVLLLKAGRFAYGGLQVFDRRPYFNPPSRISDFSDCP